MAPCISQTKLQGLVLEQKGCSSLQKLQRTTSCYYGFFRKQMKWMSQIHGLCKEIALFIKQPARAEQHQRIRITIRQGRSAVRRLFEQVACACPASHRTGGKEHLGDAIQRPKEAARCQPGSTGCHGVSVEGVCCSRIRIGPVMFPICV